MRKYYSIEILRLLTSLAVIIYHYRLFFGPSNTYSSLDFLEIRDKLPFYSFLEYFYNYGIYGVHIFYAISGFVFAHVYITKKSVGSKEFFINRFARLYPLHFATLIIVTCIQYFSFFNYESFLLNAYNDLYHFILQLFFISSWGFEKGFSFNVPIWSISVEIGIYVIFFFTLSYIQKFKKLLPVSILIFFLILDKTTLVESGFIACGILFFSGVLVYQLMQIQIKKIIFFLIGTLFFILALTGNFKTFLFSPSLLLLVVLLDDFIKIKKIKKLFRICGNLTYPLYLLHFPIMITVILIENKLELSKDIYISTTFFIIFFLIMIMISYFSFTYFEDPINKKIRNKYK